MLLFFTCVVYLRSIGEFLTTQIMPETPIESIHILFMVTVVFGVRIGLEPLARSSEIFFPFLVILLLSLFLSLSPQVHIENLQPILEDGFKPVIRGSFTFITYPFVELVVILMILPYVSQKESIRKNLLFGTLLGGSVLVVITTLAILVLGPYATARHLYPTYALAKKINIANFFTRIEAMLAGIWFITIFFKISLYFYATVLGIAQLLKLKDYRPLTFPIGMIMFVFSISIAPNIVYLFNVSETYPFYDLTIGVLLPLLLLIVVCLQKTNVNNI
jgi:spore germination protein KB